LELAALPVHIRGGEVFVLANLESAQKIERGLHLRVGEWVEVRSAAEILGTLDEANALDGLPFMPEMIQYCGRRFRVYKSAHKTCDTINNYTIRQMEDAVHLEGLRCDGEAHGGCQAACLLFWKDAWLKRAAGPHSETSSPAHPHRTSADFVPLYRSTRIDSAAGDGDERYRCQATDLLKATAEVRRRKRWDPRFYFRDLTSGNVRLRDFLFYGAFAAFNAFMLHWRGRRYPHLRGLAGQKTPNVILNLQPGDLVRVRTKDEIMATLNAGMRNRGLWFDVEMVPFCDDGVFKVLQRVDRIINEKTGVMMKLPGPCVILDGVTCGGNLSHCRMFCPRAIYPYWREAWLTTAVSPDHTNQRSFKESVPSC
jgi:hypothetical protein